MDSVRKLTLCYAHWNEKFFQEHFAGVCRLTMGRCPNHFTSSPVRSMIIHDFSGATAYEDKYKEQVLKNLKRKAAKLGMMLVPATV